jgi:dihydroxyacetone kinase-like predicted kinase
VERNLQYGYDLQFLLEGIDMPVEGIREKIESLGESVLVVGDGHLLRVHVHSTEPQTITDFCSKFGTLTDKICDNMDTQVETFKKRRSAS